MSYDDSDLFFLQQIGLHLKYYRIHQGLTQEELAEIAGFSRSYYTEIETGKRNISILNLHKLCLALDIPLVNVLDFKSFPV
ncbi:MAG TPA: helix-turn-helix transcriptional regulator [Cerasibacillus sp.]|uniref:helix-turn-helix domain-containing protein n=1 Tax=Cerasibacillus sp. TaxID=2498711 RepID=UPI002F3E30F5